MSNEFILSQKQGVELERAVGRNGGTKADIQWLCERSNFESVIRLARGKAEIISIGGWRSPFVTSDPIVRVDRSIHPVYPGFVYVNKISPEFVMLERTRPSEFDASRLRQWRHPKQRRGTVSGEFIHASLTDGKLLPSCLGYTDLIGIKAKGLEFFRQHFNGLVVFGWRTVFPDRHGDLHVPYLIGNGREVVLDWCSIRDGWSAADPALRYSPKDSGYAEICIF